MTSEPSSDSQSLGVVSPPVWHSPEEPQRSGEESQRGRALAGGGSSPGLRGNAAKPENGRATGLDHSRAVLGKEFFGVFLIYAF